MEVDGGQVMGPIDDHAIGQGYVTMRFPDFLVNAWQKGVASLSLATAMGGM